MTSKIFDFIKFIVFTAAVLAGAAGLFSLASCGKVTHSISGKAEIVHSIDLKYCYELPAGEPRQTCIKETIHLLTKLDCK